MATAATRIPRRFRVSQEQFVSGSRIRYLRDGSQAFPVMLEAIAAAREQVLVEMYWFDSDYIGRKFAAALSERAQAGVEVAVIYDSVGSIDANPSMFADMRAAGVRVLEYNPVAPWQRRFRLDRMQVRDHRKMLVVDGIIGFTGGLNLADPWAPEHLGGGGWRDDVIEMEGPVVESMQLLFERTWIGQGQGPLRRREPGLPWHEGRSRVRVLGESGSKGWSGARHRRSIRRAYLARIYHARRRVWIANSYFVPDPIVLRALRRAAKGGVDVRVLVPGRSDVTATLWAGRATYSRLLRSGVRIFEWGGNVLHAKTAVVDGEWSTIGTYNLDYRSFRYNLEVNVAVEDREFAAEIEASMERDQKASLEIDLEMWADRTIAARLLARLCYACRKIL